MKAICEALKSGRITKPLIAWCIGMCASIFPFEVQFGHAGELARGNMETARAKNQALKDAGAHVPNNFFEFANETKQIYDGLVESGSSVPAPVPETPKIPIDYMWANHLLLFERLVCLWLQMVRLLYSLSLYTQTFLSDLHCCKLYLLYF